MDDTPVDRAGTLAIAGGAQRMLVKAGQEILRFDPVRRPLTQADALAYLVHEDGLLRVPVLVVGDVLVRGYTDDLYREIFDAIAPPPSA